MDQNHETIFTTVPDFLSIKKAPGYYYAERKQKDSVAVFLFNTNKKLLVRFQPMPQFDDRLYACPITGSMEPDLLPIQVAQKEALEEGGYRVELSNVVDLGSYLVGTQTNEICHCYAWDVTFLEPKLPEGDGTEWEKLSSNGWMDFDQAFEVAQYSGLLIGLFLLRQRGLV